MRHSCPSTDPPGPAQAVHGWGGTGPHHVWSPLFSDPSPASLLTTWFPHSPKPSECTRRSCSERPENPETEPQLCRVLRVPRPELALGSLPEQLSLRGDMDLMISFLLIYPETTSDKVGGHRSQSAKHFLQPPKAPGPSNTFSVLGAKTHHTFHSRMVHAGCHAGSPVPLPT